MIRTFHSKEHSLIIYLVDPSERRHVHGLSPDGTGAANTGGVLAGSRVDDRVNEHLKWEAKIKLNFIGDKI